MEERQGFEELCGFGEAVEGIRSRFGRLACGGLVVNMVNIAII